MSAYMDLPCAIYSLHGPLVLARQTVQDKEPTSTVASNNTVSNTTITSSIVPADTVASNTAVPATWQRVHVWSHPASLLLTPLLST